MPKEIPVVFQNSSNYGYHVFIKELANEFEGQFKCLKENTENYKTSFVQIKKVTKIDKNINESVLTISHNKILLIVQDLRQVHYQILSTILWKEFTKSNVKIVIIYSNMKASMIIW